MLGLLCGHRYVRVQLDPIDLRVGFTIVVDFGFFHMFRRLLKSFVLRLGLSCLRPILLLLHKLHLSFPILRPSFNLVAAFSIMLPPFPKNLRECLPLLKRSFMLKNLVVVFWLHFRFSSANSMIHSFPNSEHIQNAILVFFDFNSCH